RDAIAARAGEDFACTVKVPAEKAPPLARHVDRAEALETCRLAQEWGFHAVTPVEVSVFPDTTLSRGGVPKSVWQNPSIKKRLRAAAPSRMRRAILIAGYYVGGRRNPF